MTPAAIFCLIFVVIPLGTLAGTAVTAWLESARSCAASPRKKRAKAKWMSLSIAVTTRGCWIDLRRRNRVE